MEGRKVPVELTFRTQLSESEVLKLHRQVGGAIEIDVTTIDSAYLGNIKATMQTVAEDRIEPLNGR